MATKRAPQSHPVDEQGPIVPLPELPRNPTGVPRLKSGQTPKAAHAQAQAAHVEAELRRLREQLCSHASE